MSEGNITYLPARVTRPKVTIEKLRGRLGRFTLSDESVQVWPDLVLMVMAQVIVLQAGRCEHWATEYLAISEQFAVVDGVDNPPMYEWVCEKGLMRARRLEPRRA